MSAIAALLAQPVAGPTEVLWFVENKLRVVLFGVTGLVVGGILALVLRWAFLKFREWLNRRQMLQATAPNAAAPLEPNTLIKIWRAFLAALPSDARDTVKNYPTVTVFGPPGVGKSQLIRSKLDWQGQASQFLPSHTDNPLLQIYLGAKLVAHEFGATLLGNASPVTRAALQKLWTPIYKRRQATAVLVFKVSALEKTPPEQMAEMAQLIRGKLTLLAQISGHPVETRICLTHMDRMRGYLEFARFCIRHRLPQEIQIQPALEAGSMREGTADYQRFLPLALTSLPSTEFCQVVQFLRAVPPQLAFLDALLQPLSRGGLAGQPPRLDRLYFFSSKDSERGSDPLAVRRENPNRWENSPILNAMWNARWALAGCAAILIAFFSFLTVVAVRHGRSVHHAQEAVHKFESAVKRAHDKAGVSSESVAVRAAEKVARKEVTDVLATDKRWLICHLMYGREKEQLPESLLGAIRQGYLLPMLEKFGAQRDIDRTLYTLGIIYSSRDNPLGGLINAQQQDVTTLLELPDGIIRDYIELTETPWTGSPAVAWSRLLSQHQTSPATSIQPWLTYFSALEIAVREKVVTPEQIRRLQQASAPLLHVTDAVRRDRMLGQIYHLLLEESPILEVLKPLADTHLTLSPPPWLRDQLTPLSGILHLIHDSDPDSARDDQLSLRQVVRLLDDLDGRRKATDITYDFELQGRPFSFSARSWLDLILRSRHRAIMGSLGNDDTPAKPSRRRHRHRSRGHRREREPTVKVASDADAGPAPPPDSYSRAQFEKDIKPLLQRLAKGLQENPDLAPEDRGTLNRYVADEVRRYAKRYCDSLLALHRSYVFPGGGVAATHQALISMVQPTGSLVQHLKTVADNANIADLKGPYLQPLATCLTTFTPLVNLMASGKEGGYPNLKPYVEIVGGIIKELDTGKPAGQKEDGKAAMLSDLVSPVGRTALAVLDENPASHERKTEQFLASIGLGGAMGQPLLAPMRHVTRLGIAEVEQAVAQQFQSTLLPLVSPLISHFPFERTADKEVQPAELEILKPTEGAFWLTFRAIFGPVVLEKNGDWSARKWQRGSLNLPTELLPMANHMTRLSRQLFTREGARQPLQISVKPLPFSATAGGVPLTMIFLRSGKAQVFGVNAIPSSRPLAISWWQSDVASVGAEFSIATSGRKQSQSIEVSDSAWSFFRLLDKATAQTDGRVMTWNLPSDGGQPPIDVRFELGSDPWQIFMSKAMSGAKR